MDAVKKVFIWLGHPMLGVAAALSGEWLSPVYALCFVLLFVFYEWLERFIVKDRADIDIKDFFIGFAGGCTGLLIWRVICRT